MATVALARDRVLFPARCVRCGGAPGGFYRLERKAIPSVAVPLCVGGDAGWYRDGPVVARLSGSRSAARPALTPLVSARPSRAQRAGHAP